MAYAAASDVASYTQNILGSENQFNTSTSPVMHRVTQWLSSGCAVLETHLNQKGYSTPVASGTVAYDWLRDLNALYAAARVEMSRTNVTLAPGERTRGQVFDEMFHRDLQRFMEGDLTIAGVTRSTSGKLYAGGISVSDKQIKEANTNRVKPRFGRGMHRFPGVIDPVNTTASQ